MKPLTVEPAKDSWDSASLIVVAAGDPRHGGQIVGVNAHIPYGNNKLTTDCRAVLEILAKLRRCLKLDDSA
jgi:hypothetical protein